MTTGFISFSCQLQECRQQPRLRQYTGSFWDGEPTSNRSLCHISGQISCGPIGGLLPDLSDVVRNSGLCPVHMFLKKTSSGGFMMQGDYAEWWSAYGHSSQPDEGPFDCFYFLQVPSTPLYLLLPSDVLRRISQLRSA